MIQKKIKILIFLASLLILVTLFSLVLGDSNTSLSSLLGLLFGAEDSSTQFIITKIRLPRILAALLGGAPLALSGIILQTITKNPLADSGILGINAGAGMIISLVVSFGSIESPMMMKCLPFLAMLGSFTIVTLVYLLSKTKTGKLNPVTLIITGVMFSMILSSLMIAIVGNINKYKVDYMANWLSGRIIGDDWSTLLIISPLLIFLMLVTYQRSYKLNIMSLTDQVALSLGLNLEKERRLSLILATALAGTSVCLIGNISFIGLLAGHLSRQLIGNDHRITLPVGAIIGMLILLIADTCCRVFLVGSNIPTGILVSIIGAPYFLYVMTKIKS